MPSRTNAPLCGADLGPGWIDSGTSVLNRSEPPVPLGAASNAATSTLVIPSDLPHRLLLAARSGLPYLAPELRAQIAPLLTLKSFAYLAGFLAADMAFAGTGVGTVINVVAAGLVIAVVGTQALSSSREFLSFYRRASTANTPGEFQVAGQEFARAVALLGIATVMTLLAGRGQSRSFGAAASTADAEAAEAAWIALADSIEFEIPANEGVIYQGISPQEAVEAIVNSSNPAGKIINDVATRHGWTQEAMEADFGAGYSARTYRLWERLSLRYQQSLKGRVTAYMDRSKLRFDQGMLEEGRGAGAKQTPSVILTELEELMSSNKSITRITVKDVKTGQSWEYTPAMKSRLNH